MLGAERGRQALEEAAGEGRQMGMGGRKDAFQCEGFGCGGGIAEVVEEVEQLTVLFSQGGLEEPKVAFFGFVQRMDQVLEVLEKWNGFGMYFIIPLIC